MPLTDGFTSRGLALKGKGHIHSAKWHSCWEKVQAKGHTTSSAAAICTTSVGYQRSLNPEHQTPGKHWSDKPKGWIPPEKRKAGETSRSRSKIRGVTRSSIPRKKADTYAEVLKWNPFHGLRGWFTSREKATTVTQAGPPSKRKIRYDAKFQKAMRKKVKEQQRKDLMATLQVDLFKMKAKAAQTKRPLGKLAFKHELTYAQVLNYAHY